MTGTREPRFLERLGCTIVKEGPRAPYFQIDVAEQHLNVNSVVHGSVLHALLDSVMGLVAFRAKDRQPVATVEVTVRYLRPVSDGRLRAYGRVIQNGKRIVVVESTIERDDDPEPVALGHATFMLI